VLKQLEPGIRPLKQRPPTSPSPATPIAARRHTLTGLRQVRNCQVTVERKETKLIGTPAPTSVLVHPALQPQPQFLDEQVSRDVLLNRLPELPSPA
jgi:hypothetical protein